MEREKCREPPFFPVSVSVKLPVASAVRYVGGKRVSMARICREVKMASSVLSPLHRAYKTIEDDDLKFPLIYGEGKKVRCAR